MGEIVLCHSEIEYPERPISFYWKGQQLIIECILSRWRTPEGKFFSVRTDDNEIFTLHYNEISSEWNIDIVEFDQNKGVLDEE